MKYITSFTLFSILVIASCSSSDKEFELNLSSVQDSSHIAFTITDLDGPEAVRYSPSENVYFISNFTGGGNDQDSTGFITKADPQGKIVDREFMTGSEAAPLHAPRGMYILEGTLWAADVLGLHGFDIKTGAQTAFVDFSSFELGFLNDVVADEEGNLYVTDTGIPRVYKVENGTPSIYLDSLGQAPNGITLNPNTQKLVLAPWGGSQTFSSFTNAADLEEFDGLNGGYFDGIEYIGTVLLSASQQDSSIRAYDGATNDIIIKTTGRPADIGINTNLHHIAVPYIALDRVDIWDLNK